MFVETAPDVNRYIRYDEPKPESKPVVKEAASIFSAISFPLDALGVRAQQKFSDSALSTTEVGRASRFYNQAAYDLTELSGLWAGRLAAVVSTVGIVSTFGAGVAPFIGVAAAGYALTYAGEKAGELVAKAVFGARIGE